MHHLIAIARDRGLELMQGEVLSDNHKMLDMVKSLGFHISISPDDIGIKTVELSL